MYPVMMPNQNYYLNGSMPDYQMFSNQSSYLNGNMLNQQLDDGSAASQVNEIEGVTLAKDVANAKGFESFKGQPENLTKY